MSDQNDLLQQAAESTRQIAQTNEYRAWLTRLLRASCEVRVLQDERGVKRGAFYNQLVSVETEVSATIKRCDDWLEAAREKHEQLMIEVMEK